MSALPIERVHLGYWFDHSFNSLDGAIITVRSSVGNLVIAILAVIITIGGAAWWELLSFFIFSIYDSSGHQPAATQQVLVLLKNVVSPGSFLLDSLRVWWRSHKPHRPTLIHSSFPILAAVLSSWGFLVAGIFASSAVSTQNIDVLVDSQNCGIMVEVGGDPLADAIARQQLNLAWQYSQTCYSNKSAALPQCNIFTAPQALEAQEVDDQPPFPGMRIKNGSSITLDTGVISSRKYLGINSVEEDETTVRLVTSCSVLDGDEYRTVIPDFDWARSNYDYPGYDVPVYGWNFGAENSTEGERYGTTFAVPLSALQSGSSYSVFAMWWRNHTNDLVNNETERFFPIPELAPQSGDLSLIGIAADGVVYKSPVDDPLFAAHGATNRTLQRHDGETVEEFFKPDSLIEWIACREQIQYCFGSRGCTELHGGDVAATQAYYLAQTPLQAAIISNLYARGIMITTIADIAPQSIVSWTRQLNGHSVALPADQWKNEVTAWFNYATAAMRAGMAYTAMGDDVGFTGVEYTLMSPEDFGVTPLCHLQKMKAPIGISNISVLSLGLTIGISGLLFLLNLFLLPILRLLDHKGMLSFEMVRRWDQHGVLHLQRRLYEASGSAEWDRTRRSMPRYIGSKPLLPSLCVDGEAERDQSLSLVTTTTVSSQGAHGGADSLVSSPSGKKE